MKILNLSRALNTRISNIAGHYYNPKFYGSVVRPTRPLLGKKDEDAREKTIQAADAVKESAEMVKDTAEFIKDVTSSTAKSVTKMTKQVSAKVSDTTDTLKEKASDALVSGAWNTAKSTATKIIKDKVKGN